ncbi:MAG TPA: hypothetical protein VMX96_00385 [Dehalococcoidia bacterium]|nr:hypothetical protein [Dehalococcoidia bacterium]
MNEIRTLFSEQLLALEARVRLSNKLGDLDGLFAYFVLGGACIGEWEWQVNCADESWIQDHESGLARGNYGFLAALGYSLAVSDPKEHESHFATFIDGMHHLQKRELFPIDGVSFPNIPRIFLGLAVGVKAISEISKREAMSKWLLEVLEQTMAHRAITSPWGLIYGYIKSLLANEPQRMDPKHLADATEMALFELGLSKHKFEARDSQKDLSEFRKRLVNEVLKTDARQLDSAQAAVLWNALNLCLTASVHELMISPSHVSVMLGRFQDAMKRWRWDSEKLKQPIRWPIQDEREIQDIVWIMLRPVFPDLVDEDTLPKFGHSSYKADFGIPALGLLIEVKMAGKAGDFKKIEQEIMQDAIGYLIHATRYSKLLVFIYDESASVQEHGTTIQALKVIPEIEDVIIVSKPSHLP